MSYPTRSFSLLLLFGILAAASAVPLFAIQEELKQASDSSTVDSGFQRISIASLHNADDKRLIPKTGLAPSPELVQLYRAVEQRGFCEEVFVAVLQGSKEGHVVDMFPPGPDGSRTKEGHVVSLFPPGPDGSRKKEGVQNNDPIPGIDIIVDKDAPSANPHNSTRSNRGIRLDDQAEIVQCEGCGATCTEPCRCKPRGIELIWGQKGDLVRIFQKENQYHYVTFETDYGMRAVTLISMGEDQTLVIAKAWHASTDSPEEACPGIGGGDCNDRNREINPLAGVGVAHNRLLDYLTADLDLRLPAFRHSNDIIVRKKPGRSAKGDLSGEGSDLFVRKRPGRKSFGDITLKKRSGTITEPSKAYLDACLFLSRVYDLPASGFLPAKQALVDMEVMTRDGYGYLQSLQKSVAGNAPLQSALQNLEQAMLLSPDLKSFEAEIDRQVTQTLASRELPEGDRSLVLGALALGKSTVVYWNAQNDIFEGDLVARGKGKFWADVGGFISGFTGTLVYNNNVSGDPLNPFTNGVAVGGLASALADNDDDEEN